MLGCRCTPLITLKYKIVQAMYYIMRKRRSHVSSEQTMNFIRLGMIASVVLLLVLPFHYVTGPFMIVPKNNWGFSNTIITQYEVNDAMHTYNISDKMEKEALMDQAWMQHVVYKDSYTATLHRQ